MTLGVNAARPELGALRIADPPERWAALGFTVDGTELILGGVQILFGNDGVGITGWSVRNIPPVETIDGLPTAPPPSTMPAAADHPNGAIAIDHVVVVTPDFDRTASALQRAGMPLRRIRGVGGERLDDPGAFRQGFRRLRPAILELVEARGAPAGPAAFWGLVVTVSDLDALSGLLGERLSPPKSAVQPGRRIATLRACAGLSPHVAFMDPEPCSSPSSFGSAWPRRGSGCARSVC